MIKGPNIIKDDQKQERMDDNEYFCDECEAIIEGKPFTVENTNGKFCDWFCAAHQHSIEMNVTIKPLYVRDDHENG